MARLHGGEISAGVGAMLESAGLILADARYLRAKAVAEGDDNKRKDAARLAGEAKQLELAAWELAAREAAARPKGKGHKTSIERILEDD